MKKLQLIIITLLVSISSLFCQDLSEINDPVIFDINEDEILSEENLSQYEELFIPDDIFQNSFINSEIKTSRSSTLKIFENIEIIYPGANWIFEGITDNTKDIIFISKTESDKSTKFILQARNAGQKILHFYKKDFIKNQLLDDYIEVIVKEELGNESTIVKADPFYNLIPELDDTVLELDADIIETIILDIQKEAQENKKTPVEQAKKSESATKAVQKTESKPQRNTAPAESKKVENKTNADKKSVPTKEKSVVEEETSTAPQINTEDVLKDAINLYNNKSYAEALEKINLFINFATKKLDVGYYYKGLILEEESAIQNIPDALKTYQLLLKNYPSSKYWNEANKRSIYLKKFYMEAR